MSTDRSLTKQQRPAYCKCAFTDPDGTFVPGEACAIHPDVTPQRVPFTSKERSLWLATNHNGERRIFEDWNAASQWLTTKGSIERVPYIDSIRDFPKCPNCGSAYAPLARCACGKSPDETKCDATWQPIVDGPVVPCILPAGHKGKHRSPEPFEQEDNLLGVTRPQMDWATAVTREAMLSGMTKQQFLTMVSIGWDAREQARSVQETSAPNTCDNCDGAQYVVDYRPGAPNAGVEQQCPTCQPSQKATDEEAKRLYNASLGDQHNLHILAWSELNEVERNEWRRRAQNGKGDGV